MGRAMARLTAKYLGLPICISVSYLSAVSAFSPSPVWSGRLTAAIAQNSRRRSMAQAAAGPRMELNKYSKKLTQNKSQGASQVQMP